MYDDHDAVTACAAHGPLYVSCVDRRSYLSTLEKTPILSITFPCKVTKPHIRFVFATFNPRAQKPPPRVQRFRAQKNVPPPPSVQLKHAVSVMISSNLIPASLLRLRAHSIQSPFLLLRTPPFSTTQFSTTSKAFALGRPSQEKTDGYLLESSQAAALLRKQLPQRTGVLAIKQGMTALFQPTGERIPCTVLQLDRVQVMGVKTVQRHGYWAVQVGLGYKKPENTKKPMLGHFHVSGVSPKSDIAEFRVKGEEGLLPAGTILKPDHFTEGQYVDVRANCKGKGFAGVRPRFKEDINIHYKLIICGIGYETSWLWWSTCIPR